MRSAGVPVASNHATRAESAVVLPVPAPARTRSGPPSWLTAASWASLSSSIQANICSIVADRGLGVGEDRCHGLAGPLSRSRRRFDGVTTRDEETTVTEPLPPSSLGLRSLVTDKATLELSLTDVPLPSLASGEVLVRIEAAPINPSDLGLLLAGADVASASGDGYA
jgi:hypothetical protein